jgi:quinoprotein glucose dehydrogenase
MKLQSRSLFLSGLALLILLNACQQTPKPLFETKITALDPIEATKVRNEIEETVSPQVIEGLSLRLWASDSLVADPIALSMDNQGRAYITRTNRQKNSEFDIRGHRDWMTASISLQTVEERRDFLKKTFASSRSEENSWFPDLNQDGLHDWRDLTVEKEQVYRIEDRDGDYIADYSQLFLEDFHTEVTDVAGALLVHEDEMFVGVAPDMWRIRDQDNDGVADYKESISNGYMIHIGFGAHGMSGARVGPEGKIYWGIGDIGSNIVDQTGKRWFNPNRGAIFRSNPDGSDFEVFCMGIRNTHEFVFDELGNLISVDNDGDHPGEKERLVYLVNGSDSGWRTNWQFGKYTDPDNNRYKVWMDEKLYLPRWEGQAAYILPPIMNYHSGPAGMVYNPGTALGDRWKNHFFFAEFTGTPARSHVWAFTLEPKGAGFEFVQEQDILTGILPTGLAFGPEGALYVADWIDGWGTKGYGRIWRLDLDEVQPSLVRQETEKWLKADFAELTEQDLYKLLFQADKRVRQKAQFALAKEGSASREIFLKAARQDQMQARIHGLWGLWQLALQDRDEAQHFLPFLQDAEAEIRAQAAKILGDVRYQAAGDALLPLLQDESARVQFFTAEALGRIAHKPAVAGLIDLLERNNDQDLYLRHAASLALARIGETEPLVALAEHGSKALRTAAVIALRRMEDPQIARFLEDRDEYIVAEAARAIHDDFSIPDALPALAELIQEDRFTSEPLLRRILSANLRLGEPQNLQWLTEYAQRENAPEAMRIEAIACIGVWAKPSVLDRVDGRLRGPVKRELPPTQQVAEPVLSQLLQDSNPAIQVAAANSSGRLQLQSLSPALQQMALNHREPTVRSEALTALYKMEAPEIQEAMQAALRDRAGEVRVTALKLVPYLSIPGTEIAELLGYVIESGSVSEQQEALHSLGQLPAEANEDLLRELLAQLRAGQIASEIQLDLTEVLRDHGSAELQTALQEWENSQATDDPLALYASALKGGDARKGRRVVFRHEAAQCVRCHNIGQREGSDVGPELTQVGNRLSREELLLSLVAPSDQLADGYGIVSLTMKNGEKLSGTLLGETKTQLRLQTSDAEPIRIPKTEIARRQNAPSAMPAMGNILSKAELRDVVEFLTTLQ